jgi:hypothetical protein
MKNGPDTFGAVLISRVLIPAVCLSALTAPMVQLVFRHLPAQRVAVNPQQFRGTRLVPVGAFQDALDEALFEFTHGFIKQDAAFHHLYYKAF